MKIRTGFVSNSSTSSFICEVCGNVEAGMDISLSEAGMVECINGHTYCDIHAYPFVNPESATESSEEDEDERRYEFPSEKCPLCNFVVPDINLVNDYVSYFIYSGSEKEAFENSYRKHFNLPDSYKICRETLAMYMMWTRNVNYFELTMDIKKKYGTFENARKAIPRR